MVYGAALEKRSPRKWSVGSNPTLSVYFELVERFTFASQWTSRHKYNARKADMDQEWFFYVARCKDNSLYCGITNNLEDRLKEHNKGIGARYTRSRRPVAMVYNEKYNNISEAMKREAQIKGWSKAEKERLIVGFSRLRSE